MINDIEFVTILYDLLNSYNDEVSGILERKDTLIEDAVIFRHIIEIINIKINEI